MCFKDKLSFIVFQIISRFKSYHQIIKSNQTFGCFVLFCFVSFCLMIMIAL